MFQNEFISENNEETKNNIDLSRREGWFRADDVEKELREL